MRCIVFTLVRASNSGCRRAPGQAVGIIEFGLRVQGVAVGGRCEHHSHARERKRAPMAAAKAAEQGQRSAHFERSALPLENELPN